MKYTTNYVNSLTTFDVTQPINIQRLRWFGHDIWLEEHAPAKRVLGEVINECRGMMLMLEAIEKTI